MRLRLHIPSRGGFTLVEAVIAISLAAMAGAVLLAGINASVKVTDDGMREMIALGTAQQLMDEALGNLWGGSTTSPPRTNFDQIDDFADYQSMPPVDPSGIALGKDDGQGGERHPNFQATSGLLDRWQQQVLVYPVDLSNPSVQLTSGTSECHAVEVRIIYNDPQNGARELARLRRVIAHVAPLP
jgi:type II secretory pathway pseudopilin PulG